MLRLFPPLAALTAALLLAPGAAARGAPHYPTPAWFYPQALCVHAGRHYVQVRRARGAEYVFGPGLAFAPAHSYDDVPDSLAGGSGEGGWQVVNGYGGGLQMMVGTYNRAAGMSRGRLPYAADQAAIARLPPVAQIYAAYLIVKSDGGSWAEWPLTSRACGYP